MYISPNQARTTNHLLLIEDRFLHRALLRGFVKIMDWNVYFKLGGYAKSQWVLIGESHQDQWIIGKRAFLMRPFSLKGSTDHSKCTFI